ncbi:MULTISPECIES: ParA family protein [unclassified Nocardia]|uniref:ParA family protein n=1 Tax=unclassified Nocardia TaxID=2637762 RepID=UPI0024A8EA0F|nr:MULTISPECIES: ParA family protein [unclassified Nocardia]
MKGFELVELRGEVVSGERARSVGFAEADGFDWAWPDKSGRILHFERPQRIWEQNPVPGRTRPYVVATFNLKGGVGKTTTTAALAEILSAEFGKRVLLIDLDPQRNLTTMMVGERRAAELDRGADTLAAVFGDVVEGYRPRDAAGLVQPRVSAMRTVTSVDLLPSSLKLIALQDDLSHVRAVDPTALLADSLSGVLFDYDYVLIDCPPSLGLVTQNGLRIADGYLVPTIPDFMSTYGIPAVQARIRQLSARWGAPIEELGVVVTKYRRSSAVHQRILDDLRRDRSLPRLFPTRIPESNQIAAAAEYLDFGSLRQKYGTGGQFLALRELTDDFLSTTRIKLAWGR